MHDLLYVPALMNGRPITSQANKLGWLDYHIFWGMEPPLASSRSPSAAAPLCGQAGTKVSWFYLPFILNFLLNSGFVIEGAGIWYPVLFLLLLTDYLHFSVNKVFLFVLVLCLKFYSSVALLLELNWFLLERNWSLSKFRCEALFRSSCLSNHLYSCFFAESRISVCSDNESCW